MHRFCRHRTCPNRPKRRTFRLPGRSHTPILPESGVPLKNPLLQHYASPRCVCAQEVEIRPFCGLRDGFCLSPRPQRPAAPPRSFSRSRRHHSLSSSRQSRQSPRQCPRCGTERHRRGAENNAHRNDPAQAGFFSGRHLRACAEVSQTSATHGFSTKVIPASGRYA